MDKQNQSLTVIMSSLLTTCREFHLLLQEEHAILEQPRDINAFMDILARKTAIFDRLSTSEKEFFVSLSSTGHEQVKTTMAQLVKNDPALQPVWQELRDLLKQCRDLNMLNGVIVNASAQHARRVLDFMLPQQTQQTYNAQGAIK